MTTCYHFSPTHFNFDRYCGQLVLQIIVFFF
jgi:hypothetical protein